MSEQHWYRWKDLDDGRSYFLAFVNALNNCSARAYDAVTGEFEPIDGKRVLYVQRDSGGPSKYYEREFDELVKSATLLFRAEEHQWRPNLEKDCKRSLPSEILSILQEQSRKKGLISKSNR